jgi:ferritin-like metal-binding protein YciE
MNVDMSNDKMREKLVDYVQDAHAMEMNVQMMLTSMIASTDNTKIKKRLEKHLEETKEQADRLQKRLDDLDEGASLRKEGAAIMASLPKGMLDQVRGDKPGKNARDGFVTEALEIAAYQLLERLAERAGDEKTVRVARRNRAEEERMREFFDRNWDLVVDLTLKQEGIAA